MSTSVSQKSEGLQMRLAADRPQNRLNPGKSPLFHEMYIVAVLLGRRPLDGLEETVIGSWSGRRN